MDTVKTMVRSKGHYVFIVFGTAAIGYTVIDVMGYSCALVVGRSMQPTFNPSLPCSNHEIRSPPKNLNNTLMPNFMFNTIRYVKDMFQPLDWVLISSRYRYNVKAGDIVTLHNAMKPYDKDIKRVTGTDNQVVISNSYKNRTVFVPRGYIWVEGDNRIMSSDSNRYGPIPASLVYGKAVAIIWPPSRWQRLPSQTNPSTQINASELPHDDLSDIEEADQED